ncbi:MAG: hypothetical protein NXI31_23895 [bacterium]|nr:hypothetical protein [bacterium]
MQSNLAMRSALALSVTALSATTLAQTNVPVTVTAGTATYTQGALPITEDATVGDSLSAGTTDVLQRHWWFFRGEFDRREYAFRDDGTATRTAVGPTVTTSWSNLGHRGQVSATLVQTLTMSGTAGARVNETMTLTNLTNAPLRFDLFSYADFDAGGNPLNIARGNRNSHVVGDGLTQACEFRADGQPVSQVGPPSQLLPDLTDTTKTDLLGWGGEFGPNDYAAAFQWTIEIPANGSRSVSSDLVMLDCQPQLVSYGTGTPGANGMPVLDSEFAVTRQQTSSTAIRISNGLGNSLSALLLGLTQTNQTISGINFLVIPNGTPTFLRRTFPDGVAMYDLTLPGGIPFCGLNLYAQGFIYDPSSSNGVASGTQGLRITLGAW